LYIQNFFWFLLLMEIGVKAYSLIRNLQVNHWCHNWQYSSVLGPRIRYLKTAAQLAVFLSWVGHILIWQVTVAELAGQCLQKGNCYFVLWHLGNRSLSILGSGLFHFLNDLGSWSRASLPPSSHHPLRSPCWDRYRLHHPLSTRICLARLFGQILISLLLFLLLQGYRLVFNCFRIWLPWLSLPAPLA